MKRFMIGSLVLLAAGCSNSPEDFSIEIRCAEQAYDSAGRVNDNMATRTLFVLHSVVWLRKSAGLPVNALSVPEAAKREMFRLDAIARPTEMPLPCTLSDSEVEFVANRLMGLDWAVGVEEMRARELLEALTV